MNTTVWKLFALLAMATLSLLAACSGSESTPSPTPAPPGVTISSSPSENPSPPPESQEATVTIDENQNGESLTVQSGARLSVILHSTYWTIGPPSASGVLTVLEGPVTQEATDCVPGGGCGAVTVSYQATADGTEQIQASRTLCGEAFRCSPDQGRFSVTVTVSAP